MSDLAKRKKLSPAAKRELEKHGLDIQVGDVFVDPHYDGQVLRISKITKKKIHYDRRWSSGEWSPYGTSSPEEFSKEGYIKIDKPIEEVEREILDKVKNLDKEIEEYEEGDPETTALSRAGDKEFFLKCESDLVQKQRHFALMRAILDRKRSELSNYMHELGEKLEHIRKVLGVVELYLGIHEEIIQIKEGEPMPANFPIYIRQQLLYMDEEVGDPSDGGLDFRSLEDFDIWLTDPEHLQQVLPEEKGIVAFRVRRRDKNYIGVHPFVACEMNAKNMRTYFLIRNGENLYRIWSNVTVDPRLFPRRDEFKPKIREDPFWEGDAKKAEFQYKKYGLMIQGLIHRTQILHPIDTEINIFKPETWNDRIVFIRDDEQLLPSGRLPWREWQKEINSKIKVGSRILYEYPGWYNGYMTSRVAYHLKHVRHPASGVYAVIPGPRGETDLERLRFLYQPGDEVWHEHDYWDDRRSGYQPRKNRVGFQFSSNEVLNYDQISLEDIEFYLGSRVDRGSYVHMIPLLWQLKKQRRVELEREKHFVSLVAGRNKVVEEEVWKAVEWWKYKNKWKRPLEQDDAKALRMIEKKLKRRGEQ